jgi:hypothetical protein
MNEDDPYCWRVLSGICSENLSFTDFAWHDEGTFESNGNSIPRQKLAVSVGNPQPKELGK